MAKDRLLRLGLAQINTVVGDLKGNGRRIVEAMEEARRLAVDVLVFPEQAIPGYPAEDLLLKAEFIEENLRVLDEVVAASEGLVVVVGFADRREDIYNAAAVVQDGRLQGVVHKTFLPNYSVFDEDRYFALGRAGPVFRLNGTVLGVSVCEDIWYPNGPPQAQALVGGAEILINISASPYHLLKVKERERMLLTRAVDNRAFVVLCNLVGGQDELVFDGSSVAIGPDGQVLARAPSFEEALVVVDIDPESSFRRRLHDPRRRKERLMAGQPEYLLVELDELPDGDRAPLASDPVTPLRPLEEEIYEALKLGTRDYVRKNGFETVLVGLSGGIDSALTATIAVDALGPSAVRTAFMPSRYSSPESREDANQLARNLGVELVEIPIEEVFQSYLDEMEKVWAGTEPGVAEENIQARIRGNILMALSNRFGWLVLTTGNKSEMSVGYATLYGDMAGGFAVIKDVPKMQVYRLARYRNALEPVMPERILTKAPSAELRADQRDTDSLPPYQALDPILQLYVEDDLSLAGIIRAGHGPEMVRRVIQMVDRAEYKRRQAPPGPRVTSRAFGKDRRLPITNKFRSR